MTMIRKLAFATLAAPLALGLSACSNGAEGSDAGEIDSIAPPEGQNWIDMAAKTPEGGFVIGNPDAPVKLVEFASHTCAGCAGFSATGAKAIEEEYVPTGMVSYEIRNLIRDPIDLTIAVMAHCGGADSFHPLANQAWAELNTFNQQIQQNGAEANAAMEGPEAGRFIGLAQAAGLFDFFAARGVSRDQAQACLADTDNIRAIATRSQEGAAENNVSSTPTFLINGENVGPHNWDSLEPLLKERIGG